MILEPKHKNFTGPLQIKETVKKNIHYQAPYVYTKGFWMLLLEDNSKLVTQSL